MRIRIRILVLVHVQVRGTDGIDDSDGEINLPNVVTAILASYRGYDTFGETTVILTAGVGVILLLRRERRTTGQPEPPPTDADTGGPA